MNKEGYLKPGETSVPPITFRLYQSVRFNRPVDKDRDCISPGGYEVIMQCEDGTEKSVQFDFEHYEGGVKDNDPYVVEMVQKNPDLDAFEGLTEVTEYMLRHITGVKEWFIYTGEPGETEDPLVPVDIIEPVIELISDYNAKSFDPENSRIPITIPIAVSGSTEAQ